MGDTARRASPIHRRRARAASFITAYLLLRRAASASPPEQCTTFAGAIDAPSMRLAAASENLRRLCCINRGNEVAPEDRRSPTASLRSCSPQRARPQTPSGSPLPHAMAQRMQPVAQGLWSSIPPEKEYNFGEDDCCCFTYSFWSGGGTQKLKLYEHDIAWETTCPCPWPILAAVCTVYFYPINCCVFWSLKGKTFVRRKPYTKLNSVEVDRYNGDCPACCCPSTIFIKGFFGFGENSCVPLTPTTVAPHVVDEMASELEMRIALAGQKAGLVTAQPLMPPPPPTGRNLCPNCGARLEGTFCGQCGTRAA